MTGIKQNGQTSGTTLLVVEDVDEFGKPTFIIKSDKMKAEAVVYKSNDGFAHFKIRWTKGPTPKALSGSYTGSQLALKAAIKYIEQMKQTKTQRTETYYEENH